jgi:hypothetical protein
MLRHSKRATSTLNQQRGIIYTLLNENTSQWRRKEEKLGIIGYYALIGFI